jgi:dienelactone hydrolase
MIASLAKFIDWCVIQAATVVISPRECDQNNSKLTEAIEFLNGPNFIPTESKPAEPEFTSDIHFKFSSPKLCEFAENNVVHGRLYRRGKDWQKFPTLILLHGACDFLSHRFGFPLKVPAIHRAGFNAATLVGPYHFQRRVRHIEWDHLREAESLGQAIAEIRALAGWLLDQGCPSLALFGVSLGGWLAGMAATRDSRLRAVVLTVPRVRSNLSILRGERVLWTAVRKALERRKAALEAWDTTPTNLTLSQPAIPKENILFIQGRYDLLAIPESIEDLRQKWGQPEIWRLPHGHISWIFTPGLIDRMLDWLKPKLEADKKNNV